MGLRVTALLIPGDITDSKFCQHAVKTTVERFGQLDILVNNAPYQQTQDRIEDISDAEWDLTFRTNIYSYFYMVEATLPYLEEGSAIIIVVRLLALKEMQRSLTTLLPKGQFMPSLNL